MLYVIPTTTVTAFMTGKFIGNHVKIEATIPPDDHHLINPNNSNKQNGLIMLTTLCNNNRGIHSERLIGLPQIISNPKVLTRLPKDSGSFDS